MAPGPSKPAMPAKLAGSKRKRMTVTRDEPNANGVDPGEDEAGEHDPNSQPQQPDEHQAPSKENGSKRQKRTDTGNTTTKIRAVTKKKQKKPFPFLSLPPELRNKIYEYALADTYPISPGLRGNGRFSRGQHAPAWCLRPFQDRLARRRHAPAWYLRHFQDRPSRRVKVAHDLLQVNKQINSEAKSFLYGNDIAVGDGEVLLTFLSSIGFENRALLKRITVCNWDVIRKPAVATAMFSLLSGCKNLQRLQIATTRALDDIGTRWFARYIIEHSLVLLQNYAALRGSTHDVVDIFRFYRLDPFTMHKAEKDLLGLDVKIKVHMEQLLGEF